MSRATNRKHLLVCNFKSAKPLIIVIYIGLYILCIESYYIDNRMKFECK